MGRRFSKPHLIPNTPFPHFTFPRKSPGKGCTPLCQKVLGGKNNPFACISLGKVSFCLISFDAQLCLKRNLEGGIVSWIVRTYLSLRKFYTTEVEKNPKNHLSLSKRRQKRLCLPLVNF